MASPAGRNMVLATPFRLPQPNPIPPAPLREFVRGAPIPGGDRQEIMKPLAWLLVVIGAACLAPAAAAEESPAAPPADDLRAESPFAELDGWFRDPPVRHRLVQYSGLSRPVLPAQSMRDAGIGGIMLFMGSEGHLPAVSHEWPLPKSARPHHRPPGSAAHADAGAVSPLRQHGVSHRRESGEHGSLVGSLRRRHLPRLQRTVRSMALPQPFSGR